MNDLQLGRALGLVLRTTPFLIARAAIYFGFAALWIGGCLGGLWLGGKLGGETGAVCGFWIGLALTLGSFYLVREYLLYIVKAGHIAVLVDLHDGVPLPSGKAQLGYAKDRVAQTFTRANVFFGLDQVIKGVVRVLTSLVSGIGSLIPGLDTVVGPINKIIGVGLGNLDEVILALNYRTRSDNPWVTSRQGLVLYAQNARRIFKSAAWLCLVYYALLVPFLIAAVLVTFAVVRLAGADAFWLPLLAALMLTWSAKKAFVEPVLMTALMGVYFRAIEGQVPHAEWDAKLARMSKKFQQLGEKAMDWAKERGQPAPGAAAAQPVARPPTHAAAAPPYGAPHVALPPTHAAAAPPYGAPHVAPPPTHAAAAPPYGAPHVARPPTHATAAPAVGAPLQPAPAAGHPVHGRAGAQPPGGMHAPQPIMPAHGQAMPPRSHVPAHGHAQPSPAPSPAPGPAWSPGERPAASAPAGARTLFSASPPPAARPAVGGQSTVYGRPARPHD